MRVQSSGSYHANLTLEYYIFDYGIMIGFLFSMAIEQVKVRDLPNLSIHCEFDAVLDCSVVMSSPGLHHIWLCSAHFIDHI